MGRYEPEEIIERMIPMLGSDFSVDDYNTVSNGDIEYQVRDYSNGQFSMILVRFCDDETQSYHTFREFDYESPYDLIEAATSEDTIYFLEQEVEKRLRKKMGLI